MAGRVTHENLVYDLAIARHEPSIVQWLERLTGTGEGHGFDSRCETSSIISN